MPKLNKAAARQKRRGDRARPDRHANLVDRIIREEEVRKEPVRTRAGLVTPLTDGQRRYDAAIKGSDIVFGVGPAGTGKTWFAVQRAAEALRNKEIDKIYITRPNVEVGRGFGFLPGDLDEKYSAYLLPLTEAFEEAFGSSHFEFLVKKKIIDARPLAFMRGSTLKNGWVIADEMQNATADEFKMLLTRFGEGGKMIINGDPRQTDQKVKSGLIDSIRKIGHIRSVSTVEFARDDIVRHGIVQEIIDAYEKPSDERYNETQENNSAGLERYLNAGAVSQ